MAELNPKELQQELEELRKIVAVLQIQGCQNQNQEHTPIQKRVTSTVSQIPTIQKFSYDKNDWTKWITYYERYRIVTEINTASQKMQITNLLLHMGPEVDRLLEQLDKTESSIKTETKEMFDQHFKIKNNIIYERAKFNLRQQHGGESALEYILEVLTTLSKSCNYGKFTDEFIRDKLVVGIKDHKLSEQLQLDDKWDLKKAIEKIAQSELIREQTKDIRSKIAGTSNIDKIKKSMQIKAIKVHNQENHSHKEINVLDVEISLMHINIALQMEKYVQNAKLKVIIPKCVGQNLLKV